MTAGLVRIVRLDRAHRRPVAEDTGPDSAIELTALIHQSLILDRSRDVARLCSTLREFIPSALLAFDDLDAPDASSSWGGHQSPTRAPRAEMITLLRAAAARGMTLFDTAEVYGPSHNKELVGGHSIRSARTYVIATRFGFAFDQNATQTGVTSRPEDIRAAVDGSLRPPADRGHRPALPAPRRPTNATEASPGPLDWGATAAMSVAGVVQTLAPR